MQFDGAISDCGHERWPRIAWQQQDARHFLQASKQLRVYGELTNPGINVGRAGPGLDLDEKWPGRRMDNRVDLVTRKMPRLAHSDAFASEDGIQGEPHVAVATAQ